MTIPVLENRISNGAAGEVISLWREAKHLEGITDLFPQLHPLAATESGTMVTGFGCPQISFSCWTTSNCCTTGCGGPITSYRVCGC